MGSLVWHPVWTAVPCFACPHSPYRPSEIGLAFLQPPISMPPVGESWRRSAMAILMTTAMAAPLRSLPKLDAELRGEVSMKKVVPRAHCHPWEIGLTRLAPPLPHRPSGGPGRPRQAFRETRASLHWKKQWMLRDFQVRPDNFQVDLKTPRCPACMK